MNRITLALLLYGVTVLLTLLSYMPPTAPSTLFTTASENHLQSVGETAEASDA